MKTPTTMSGKNTFLHLMIRSILFCVCFFIDFKRRLMKESHFIGSQNLSLYHHFLIGATSLLPPLVLCFLIWKNMTIDSGHQSPAEIAQAIWTMVTRRLVKLCIGWKVKMLIQFICALREISLWGRVITGEEPAKHLLPREIFSWVNFGLSS